MPTVAQIPTLTPLRGIAAFLVALLHYTDAWLPNLDTTRFTMLIDRGYLWVDFFFILSGFVMAHVYGAWFERGVAKADYLRFMVARFARIYPLHLFVLLGFVGLEAIKLIYALNGAELLSAPFSEDRTLYALLTSLLLVHSLGLHDSAVWNLPSWSISLEWYAYVIFPFLAIFLIRRGVRFALGMLALLFALIYWFASFRGHLNVIYDYGIVRCVLEFLIGMMVYRIYASGWGKSWLSSDLVFWGAFATALTVMHLGGFDAYVIPAFALTIVAGAHNRGTPYKALNTRWLIFLGKISYALYMSHMLLQQAIGRAWRVIFGGQFFELDLSVAQSLGVLVAQMALVVLVAWAMHRLIERPAHDRVRRFARARADRYGAARDASPSTSTSAQ